MTLTPSDVEQKTFSTALRGYDLDEVDDFLDEVVATIRELNDQIAVGAAAPAEVPTEAPPPPPPPAPEPAPMGDESAVGRALIAAQETADRIIADAREEADRILAEARVEADTLTTEREQRKAEAEAEMNELSNHVAGVRSQLAVLATAVADRLDEMNGVISSEPGLDREEDQPDIGELAGELGGDEPSDSEEASLGGELVEAGDDSGDDQAAAEEAVGLEEVDDSDDWSNPPG